jgi:hypothetical protein
MLRARIPFVPEDLEEVELIDNPRKGILGVRLSRQRRLVRRQHRGTMGEIQRMKSLSDPEQVAIYHRPAVASPDSLRKLEDCQDYCLSKWGGHRPAVFRGNLQKSSTRCRQCWPFTSLGTRTQTKTIGGSWPR